MNIFLKIVLQLYNIKLLLLFCQSNIVQVTESIQIIEDNCCKSLTKLLNNKSKTKLFLANLFIEVYLSRMDLRGMDEPLKYNRLFWISIFHQ